MLGYPSSAPAERLFSFGVIIRRAERNHLPDDSFETFVLLKAKIGYMIFLDGTFLQLNPVMMTKLLFKVSA